MDITIHEVAKLAKVSVSTASRILNGGTKGLRRDAVRRAQRVMEAARELGYSPNTAARSLVTRRSCNIGLIATELNNPVRSKLIESLRVNVLDKGYQLLVSGVKNDGSLEPVIRTMTAQRVDGLILGNVFGPDKNRLCKLWKQGMPIVSFGYNDSFVWDHINIDYQSMASELTEHLIKVHGRKRIVFAGVNENYPRMKAYTETMRRFGLNDHIMFCKCESLGLESGRKLGWRISESGDLPEAVVCHNDLLAIGLIAGLREKGLRVPEQMAVLGIDNIDMGSYINPTLTTAGADPELLVQMIINRLVQRIEKNDKSETCCHDCKTELFFRESCGCERHKTK